MKHQEKKYRVDSFDQILKKLQELDCNQVGRSISTHYYAKRADNNVTKLVEKTDRYEIHVLEEDAGRFTLKENIVVDSNQAGLKWLEKSGFTDLTVVKMDHTDYEYKGGLVGLYTINDELFSVILDFPSGQHETIAADFGMEAAEVIVLPYNKYLESLAH